MADDSKTKHAKEKFSPLSPHSQQHEAGSAIAQNRATRQHVGESPDYDQWTEDELRHKADLLGIPNAREMDRYQLLTQLHKHLDTSRRR